MVLASGLERIVSAVYDVVWSPVLVGLLIFAGLYFTFRTRCVQVRRIGRMAKLLNPRNFPSSGNGVSSFEAFCMALSGRVGTGNIVGVATAIALGGPGAVFWMWVIAFFGASTAFVESTLAQIYKFKHQSGWRGGPFSYINDGLKSRWLGAIFAIAVILGYGLFLTTVQANGVSSALNNSFHLSPWISGIALAFVLALVVVGGIKRISKVAAVVTPFMAIGYLLISLVVIAVHWRDLPATFSSIFSNAFGINPLCGGIIGSTIMMGVKRGLFSNEAGQGGGAIVSAAADVKHPAQQGLVQAFSVYIDTLLVCTATALMILSSGTFNVLDASTGEMLYAGAPQLGDNYVSFTQSAVDSVFAGFGSMFVSIALVFFVFTTVMAYYFYSDSSIIYLCNVFHIKNERILRGVFQLLLLAATVFGAVKETNLVWQLGDIGVGMLAWINVIVILILCPKAIEALKDYEKTL